MSLSLTRSNEFASILLVVFAATVFYLSREFPEGIGGAPGPALYPRSVAGAIAVLAVIQFFDSVVERDQSKHVISINKARRIITPVGMITGYAAALPTIGFSATTAIFLIILMYYSGATRFRIIIPIAVAVALVLKQVFIGFLNVPLPTEFMGLSAIRTGDIILSAWLS